MASGNSSRARQASPRPHQARRIAESFGTDPRRYDRTRPRYPDALIKRIVAASPGPGLVDVGCGTGVAARQFRTAGCRVLGIEPDGRMAEFARRDGLTVEVARFEDWDPAGRVFDAVTAGTAWHWVDPVAGARRAAQVLRPGGRFAAFWHAFQPPPQVNEAFATAYSQAVPDSPFDLTAVADSVMAAYQAMIDRAAAGMSEAGGFGAPQRWQFDWERVYTRDEWLDQLPTHGTMTRLAPQARSRILADVGAAIDMLGGEFTMKYSTVAVTAARAEAL